METRPAQSRLLLRLALAIADSKVPISPPRGRRQDAPRSDRQDGLRAMQDPITTDVEQAAVIPKAGWERLETLAARFESELAYADSCLAEEPPPSRMEMLIANSSELRRVAILQRFVERAYYLRLYDPRRGLQISEDLIAWTENPSPLVAVVRCRALMERANFLRILDDREGAYAGLAETSRELKANGITDPLELARQEELLGTLEANCGRMESARRLLRKALFKVRRWGDNYTLQRVLISVGLIEIYSGNFDQAEALLEEAMRTQEPDPILLRYAATNRVLGFFAGGRPQRAYRALLGTRARLGDSWLQDLPRLLQTRQMWLEGQIMNALGMDEDAIGYLKKAREVYMRAAYGYEVCFTSVDLVQAYAAQRRFAEVQRELTFALPFCSEHRPVDRHGKDAVLLLLGTLQRRGRLEMEQIRAVASRLEWIFRAPLQTFPQPLFAELGM